MSGNLEKELTESKITCIRCNGEGYVHRMKEVNYGNGKTNMVSVGKVCPYCKGKCKVEAPIIDVKTKVANDK